MPEKFLFCFNLKSGAMAMAMINLAFGVAAILGSGIELSYNETHEERLYFILGIVMGVYNLVCGVVLIYGIINAKERIVLLYMLLELVNLMILSIFCGMNMIFKESILLTMLFLICLILWYNLHCMYGFYKELAEFNSVKSGVIEITYNGQINPLMTLPEKAVDNTAV
ncbi:uncharacterized protein LOC109602506 [Aethina tumida]|uniref:uncharacterized protein LOC109602506 n=1 Tax=Aethina tumida TaxID=116153 RepID=UPI00096B107C|nr:uncharacterized protein LOC109602506 [Aethina tumida]XP_049825468.1 uncharacterized protein LOC109602506 [Aethina tumida]XP_049825470.1 uncharacterized protein LOC109602506 [Aethina tumida]